MQVERAFSFGGCASGERVSNTWATCPRLWDNSKKLGLIPDVTAGRMGDDGLRVVNLFQQGRSRKVTVPAEEAPANYVPAAAVIRRVQALSGIIGRKELVGGSSRRL